MISDSVVLDPEADLIAARLDAWEERERAMRSFRDGEIGRWVAKVLQAEPALQAREHRERVRIVVGRDTLATHSDAGGRRDRDDEATADSELIEERLRNDRPARSDGDRVVRSVLDPAKVAVPPARYDLGESEISQTSSCSLGARARSPGRSWSAGWVVSSPGSRISPATCS